MISTFCLCVLVLAVQVDVAKSYVWAKLSRRPVSMHISSVPDDAKYDSILAGDAFRMAAQRSIGKLYGKPFSTTFLVENLFGLSRLIFPKRDRFPFEVESNVQLELVPYNRTKILAKEAQTLLETTSQEAFCGLFESQHKGWLQDQFRSYCASPDPLEFLMAEPLGLAAFSTQLYHFADNSSPVVPLTKEVEIDVRGRVSYKGKQGGGKVIISIETGEIIMPGKGLKEAVQQLGKQLALRQLALNAIAKSHNAVYEVWLGGKIFSAKFEKKISDEIREWPAETNLKPELTRDIHFSTEKI